MHYRRQLLKKINWWAWAWAYLHIFEMKICIMWCSRTKKMLDVWTWENTPPSNHKKEHTQKCDFPTSEEPSPRMKKKILQMYEAYVFTMSTNHIVIYTGLKDKQNYNCISSSISMDLRCIYTYTSKVSVFIIKFLLDTIFGTINGGVYSVIIILLTWT